MHLDCALTYDGNPVSELVAVIGKDKYRLREALASIGLCGGW